MQCQTVITPREIRHFGCHFRWNTTKGQDDTGWDSNPQPPDCQSRVSEELN